MSTYKYILFGLLFLISLSLIFTRPGVGNLEIFKNYINSQRNQNSDLYLKNTLIKYPPATYFILNSTLSNFEIDNSIKIFSSQTAWLAFKISIFIAYLLSWLALLYLVKSARHITKISLLDTSIAYFGSVSIMLSSLSLAFFDIFAAPLFILSIAFIFKRRFIFAGLLYLLAISFNWVLLIFSPIFLLMITRSQKLRLLSLIIFLFIISVLKLSPGNLIWIVFSSLIYFILKPSDSSKLQLLIVNVLVFVNLFIFFGSAGVQPVRGVYFETLRPIFVIAFPLFIIWNVVLYFKSKHLTPNVSGLMKKFLIFLLLLLNFSLIPAQGSSDIVSWRQYALAATQYLNPFRAYTEVILQYPPLSMVIISFFANSYRVLIGISQDYDLAIKISIFFFYLLTVLAYLKFSAINKVKGGLKTVDKLLIILTIFSLIIQTQGLADINIYVIPTLIASINALFKRHYLLAGLLLGLTISIKWQPMILVPLFAATAFHFKKPIKESIRHSFHFLTGLLVVPTIVWALVLREPNGWFVTTRAFEFFFEGKGAGALSGQALNLNWIVTYVMHFLEFKAESLQYLGGLNRQIPTLDAPIIFQGLLFYIASFIIFVRYWLITKKDALNFLAASIMIFFSHHILNRTAYEKHLFYVPALMIPLFLICPTIANRKLLYLFDLMTVMNLIFFYGFTGPKDINRLFFGFDITIVFAAFYVFIYLWVFWGYFKRRIFL